MAFSGFRGFFKPNMPFVYPYNFTAFLPARSVSTGYNPNQMSSHNYDLTNQEPSSQISVFDKYLLHYAKTNFLGPLAEIRKLIQQASKRLEIETLNIYLMKILNMNFFGDNSGRNYFLSTVLTALFDDISQIQLATLLIQHQTHLFEYLLQTQSIPILQLYLGRLRYLLIEKAIAPVQYGAIVLNKRINHLFCCDGELATSMLIPYFSEVMSVLESRLIKFRFSEWLHFFYDFRLVGNIEQKEFELVKLDLDKLKDRYANNQLSREAYLGSLTCPDTNGLTPLHYIGFLRNFALAELFFRDLSVAAQPDEIENLFMRQSKEQCNFLHAFALSGDLPLLELAINFLITQVGRKKTGSILVELSNLKDAYEQLPSYKNGSSNESMNCFISMLRNANVEEALDYLDNLSELEKLNVTSRSELPGFPDSLFFFSRSKSPNYETNEKPGELEEDEVLLPSDLKRVLNYPA